MGKKLRVVKKKFSLKESYKKSWQYIKDSKKFIFIIIGIFLFFTFVGLFIPAPESISNWVLDYVQEVVNLTEDLSFGELISFIFFNNLRSGFLGLIFGIVAGIFPIFISLFNGYILGFVLNASINVGGILVIWKLLPHGIFELPAIFISLGLGLRLGGPFIYKYFKHYAHKKNFLALISAVLFLFPAIILTLIFDRDLRKKQFYGLKSKFENSLTVFFLVVLPLLLIAAVIEGILIFLLSN